MAKTNRRGARSPRQALLTYLRLLRPGLHLKRWVLLFFVGFSILALGLAYLLREIYQVYTFPDFVYYLTLQFLPRYVRGALFLIAGFGAIIVALWQLNRTLLFALLQPGAREENLAEVLYQQHSRRRGPKIVAIGGGAGLSTLLRGLKEHTDNLTAIVTVADDGGSTGRLRRDLGLLPPGDFRRCIEALAEAEPLMTELFEYRFPEGNGLEGHSLGNLFIAAMAAVTGNFERALLESSRVLAVRGRILPSTLADVTLWAQLENGALVEGESNIPRLSGSRIHHVYLAPADARAHPEAVRAILDADLIVLGPGSLYTSIVPNLLVEGIRQAILASHGLRVYVCNVAPQVGETEGFTVADHVEALLRHGGPHLVDWVLAHDAPNGQAPVVSDGRRPGQVELLLAGVVNKENPHFHDSEKLATQLLRLLERAPRRRGVFSAGDTRNGGAELPSQNGGRGDVSRPSSSSSSRAGR